MTKLAFVHTANKRIFMLLPVVRIWSIPGVVPRINRRVVKFGYAGDINVLKSQSLFSFCVYVSGFVAIGCVICIVISNGVEKNQFRLSFPNRPDALLPWSIASQYLPCITPRKSSLAYIVDILRA